MFLCKWCNAEIKEKNWKYCGECGSIIGYLKDLSKEGIEFPLPQGHIEESHCRQCEVDISKTRQTTKEASNELNIKLENIGLNPVKVKISLIGAPEWLKIKNGIREFNLAKEYSICITAQGNIPEKFNKDILLEIISSDGQRGDSNRWNKTNWRTQKIPIIFKIQGVGKLNIIEEVLTFNKRLPERNFSIRNTGEKCLRFVDMNIPEGFELLNSNGMSITCSSISRWGLNSNAEENFTIKVIEKLPELADRQDKEDFILSIKSCNGDYARILLHIDKEEKKELVPPRYIVGIDFGTENTSVYYLNVVDNKIEPIKIQGETRFPSYMYFPKNKPNEPPIYGRQARETAKTSKSNEGDLIRDIKLLLRSEKDVYAEEYKNSNYTNEKLLIEFISFLKKEIDTFIFEKSPAEGKVKYVFTLPVLDNSEKYKLQKEKMKKAIREVYYNINMEKDILFIKEPQAAALYIKLADILSKFDISFNNKDVICIYDSGGGTTDIALLRINTGINTIDSFEVLGTAGTEMPLNEFSDIKEAGEPSDNNDIVFAGRIADKILRDLLLINSTGNSNPSEEDINKQKNILFKELPKKENINRDTIIFTIEQCKIALDNTDKVNLKDKLMLIKASNLPGNYSTDKISYYGKLEPLMDGTINMIKSLKRSHNIKLINYIFPIGGNTNLPIVEEKLRKSYVGNHVIDMKNYKDIRMDAVARGAVLAYNTPFSNLIPYDIFWSLAGDEKREWEQIFYENNSLPRKEIERLLRVSPKSKIYLLVGIGFGESKYSIGSFMIEKYVGNKDSRLDRLYFGISEDWTLYVAHQVVDTNIKERMFDYRLK